MREDNVFGIDGRPDRCFSDSYPASVGQHEQVDTDTCRFLNRFGFLNHSPFDQPVQAIVEAAGAHLVTLLRQCDQRRSTSQAVARTDQADEPFFVLIASAVLPVGKPIRGVGMRLLRF